MTNKILASEDLASPTSSSQVLFVSEVDGQIKRSNLSYPSAWGDMLKSENLSGLTNYSTARDNLWLGTLATQNGTFTDKEDVSNKSTSVTTDQASNTKYPSVKSVYDWAIGLFATITGSQTLTNKTISGASNTLTVDGTNEVGFKVIPQNSQSSAYTLVLSDAGKHIYHPSADTTARTWTIPANSSVAYPIGTAITFINDTSAGTITISITTDTLVLSGAGTTGSRTLTANWIATATKVTSTRWIISGVNLT